MSEVCENHGRIRCGECAYIEELKERLAEQELEIERLQSTCNDLNNELFSANIERDNSLYERDSLMGRLRSLGRKLNQAIEALEDISNMDYDASQGHTHMLYDAQMHARKTLQSIKGGGADG